MSTSGEVSTSEGYHGYIGRYHNYIGGYHEYIGGIISTSGDVQYIRGISSVHQGDIISTSEEVQYIMMHVGHIMST